MVLLRPSIPRLYKQYVNLVGGYSSAGELVCKLSKGCFSDADFGNHLML